MNVDSTPVYSMFFFWIGPQCFAAWICSLPRSISGVIIKWYCSIGCSYSVYISAVPSVCQPSCSHSDHCVFLTSGNSYSAPSQSPLLSGSPNSLGCFITSPQQHTVHPQWYACLYPFSFTSRQLTAGKHWLSQRCPHLSLLQININKLLLSAPQNREREHSCLSSLLSMDSSIKSENGPL